MRRRLEKFLPIVLIALMVQILAPIGACWAAAIAASDPLQAEICHTDLGQGSSSDQGGQHQAHDGACAICCAVQASVTLDTPQTATIVAPNRYSLAVIWHDDAPALSAADIRSHAQARAPPHLS
jgi:DUF2946 family protein